MSANEKISLLSGQGVWQTKDFSDRGLPSILMCDGPHGLRKQENSVSINIGGSSLKTVCFPCACSTANSWDEQLLYELGEHLGEIAQAEKVNILLGPGINIKRNPLCGRNFEYFSEDPLLSGKLGAAWIKGLQSKGVGASVKHFCANNQETLRMSNSSVVDERTLREIYLKPFEITAREADPVSVMCSYNRLNGIYLSDNKHIIKDILIDEWKYQGFVMTDWGAMNDRVAAIKARVSLEMPGSGAFDESIRLALVRGEINEQDLDDCLIPLINQLIRLKSAEKTDQTYSLDNLHSFARVAATRSAVLLKNEGSLPLLQDEKICVIGALAANPRYQGAGSSAINSYRIDSLLDGLAEHHADFEYKQGYELKGRTSQAIIEEAIKTANCYNKIIFAAGLPDIEESEGFDRDHMRLPDDQNELIKQLCRLGKKVVVVLSAGSVIEMPWAEDVDAILHLFLSGEAAGTACADLLFGAANPSGKLAESYPIQYADHITSSFWVENEKQSFYKEGLFVGYRYFDSARKSVRFPFGHGLSYTRFTYDLLNIKPEGDGYNVSFSITNTGSCDGDEIAQIYISDRTKSVFKPEQELRAFRKVALAKGESKTISIQLPFRTFAHYDTKTCDWQVSNGQYEIRVGASSRDFRLRAMVEVTSGQDIAKSDDGWYDTLDGIPQLSDLQKLFPNQISIEHPYQRGTYDINASLGQMVNDSWFVRMMYKITEKVIAKDLGIKPDYNNPQYKMMMAASQSSALRNLVLMSPEKMSPGLAKFILRTANGIFAKNKGGGQNR